MPFSCYLQRSIKRSPQFLPRDAAMLARSWESNSVRLSARLSHACFVTNPKKLPAISLYHMKGQFYSVLSPKQWLVGDVPFHLKWRSKWSTPFKNHSRRPISPCNVSTVRASEKRSIMTNRKSCTGFPTSYRWSAYVTSKSPKGWLKKANFSFSE